MLQRSALNALALALALVLSAQPASAQDLRQSAAALADVSRLVLTGRVASVEARADAGLIYTYATVEVGELLKGELHSSTLVVKQLGGTLPALGLYISDQAAFRPGEQFAYFPALPEIAITVGFFAAEVALYIWAVRRFPILAGRPAAAR